MSYAIPHGLQPTKNIGSGHVINAEERKLLNPHEGKLPVLSTRQLTGSVFYEHKRAQRPLNRYVSTSLQWKLLCQGREKRSKSRFNA